MASVSSDDVAMTGGSIHHSETAEAKNHHSQHHVHTDDDEHTRENKHKTVLVEKLRGYV